MALRTIVLIGQTENVPKGSSVNSLNAGVNQSVESCLYLFTLHRVYIENDD